MTHRKLEKVTLTVAVETYGDDNLSSLDHILEALDGIAELSIIDYDTQELELIVKPKTELSREQETVNQEIHQVSSDTIKRVMYPNEV